MPNRGRCFSMGQATLSDNGREKVRGSRKKFSGQEGGAGGQVRLLKARGLAELGKVVSGSAAQGLWLRERKVGSQVIGDDRSRLPGKGAVGKVRR